ncbi:MAG: transcription antitermination factor NusB [Dysgonamonadaceae bacterium]|jgi:N utilization substance protein B|nr:transcription antitermination factor NusB [Dysgonamonadaceae bacterium]
MINRIIIRIKVLQIVYAYYQKDSKDLASAENELMRSFQQTYDLYHYFFLLIILLTDAEQKRLDLLKHKYLPNQEDKQASDRLANNRFSAQVAENQTLQKFIHSHGMMWNDQDPDLIKKLLHQILDSEIYQTYLLSEDAYASDREFWRKVFKNILLTSERLKEIVNDQSIYIDDDFDIVGTFVLKSIKQFAPENGAEQALLPMFKDDADRAFAVHLLHRTILEQSDNEQWINKQIKNWEIDRIALIDLYIMQIAIAELKNFPSIPINVTLNEYIDLARYYSTPKSANFINGILDAVVSDMKKEGVLFK